MAEPPPPADRYAVRPPVPGDAAALGRLHTRVWRETYAGLMTAEAHAQLDEEQAVARWERWIAAAAPDGSLPDGGRILVGVTESGDPVGFITVGPPWEDHAPVDWQLRSLNVLPEHQGTGLAQRLIAEGLGDRAALLWVARGNERAIRFYQRQGFVLDGASEVRDDGMTELRMVRRPR